jgi:hypothetical protein
MNIKNTFLFRDKQFSNKHVILSLLVIGISGIILRLNYLPLDIPFLSDAFLYFSYANDLNILNQFPNGYNFTNNGWPTLIGFIFNFSPSTEILELINIQRIISISISTLTAIPVYYLCRKFFPNYLALIGVCIFVFEPRIIINSLLGITDPLYIFLIASSLALVFSKNKNYLFLSFACVALSILVRYEGIIWFAVLTAMFFIINKNEINYKLILRYGIIILICILIIFPMLQIRIETMGDDKIISVLQGGLIDVNVSSDGENRIYSFIVYLLNGLMNLFKYLAWVMVPYLGIFVPVGIILALKSKDQKIKLLIFGLIIVLATSILYGYSRGIQDTRYLYPLYPIFSVFSLFVIEKILERTRKKKIIAIIIVSGILITSVIYLEIKSIDVEHERESIEIFKDVYSITNVINKFNHESGYLHTMPLLENNELVKMSVFNQKIKTISNIENLDLDDFIKKNSENNLTHIVIDDRENRPEFFKKLMEDEKSIEYLEKIYDSKEIGFNYHVKVFKIDFSKLR